MRLLEHLRRGSERQQPNWEAVFREQYPRLYNFFRFRTGCDDMAEEYTAEVFERAWRDRERYSHDLGQFEAWLFGIARNIAADHQRRIARSAPQLSLETVEAKLTLPESGQPQHQLEIQDDLAHLSLLLDDLTPRARELIALKYGGGLNNRQIASLTDLSESNVGTILHRTVTRLRQAWEGSQDDSRG